MSSLDSVDGLTKPKKAKKAKAPKALKSSNIAKPVPAKIGRPTTFTQDLADLICEQLATGMSMRSVSRDPDMPAMSTMFKWLREHKLFSEQYTRAKQEAADAMAEDILDIADDGHNDWMERNYGEDTVWVTNGEALQRSKLRVDTRKFLMAKMKPKVYGDKLDLTSDGKALPQPIVVLPNGDNEIMRDVVEGEIVEPGAPNPGEIQSGNIIEDING